MQNQSRDSSSRTFDVVVFGASGYTGRLVAECLAERYTPSVRWAIAGRNQSKLESIRHALASKFPNAANVPILIADSHNREAIDAITKQTKVIATTAGPFLQIGRELAASCAANGTHYCDLTGEVPFVRWLIDEHHETAKQTGAKIVPCSGFDSIPSDLGVRVLFEHARAQKLELTETNFVVLRARGGFSGGTLASARNIAELAASDRSLRKLLANPFALNPSDNPTGRAAPDQRGARYDYDLQRWTAPFVMAAVNTRVVRRSNALMGNLYGNEFQYSESMAVQRSALGAVTGSAMGVGLGLFMVALAWEPSRNLLSRVLPSPGEGPSEKARQEGCYHIAVLGHTRTSSGATGPVLRVDVSGRRDPGYGETAWMLTESAMCLATDQTASNEGGILTPATALGLPLVERLREVGMQFNIVS